MGAFDRLKRYYEKVDKEFDGYLFEQYQCLSRNGVWGTCSDCPRSNGMPYPEFCKNRDQSDHMFTLQNIKDYVNTDLKKRKNDEQD